MKSLFYIAVLAALLGAWTLPAHASLYTLDDYADQAGSGPNLVAHNGTLSGGLYTFGTNQGLTLDWSGFNPASYSLEIRFSFDTVGGGWLKILDFAHQNLDEGLYVYGDHLQFVEDASNQSILIDGPGGVFQNGQFVDLTITRDAASKLFTGSINGVQQFSFIDSKDEAIFAGASPIANFFIDDTVTGGREANSGKVDFISIPTQVPLPGMTPLWLVATLLLFGSRRNASV
jgi:hypothetical protein